MRIISCALLLFCFFSAKAQYNFSALDQWLKDNRDNFGGRAVLMIYKDGKIIYNESYNHLTTRQRAARKFIARRQGKDVSEALKDFDENTQQPIASCSKWLSAALVMTFVDEGKLKPDDSVGTYLPEMTAHGKGHITIAQCLAHLTGIKQEGIGESKDGAREIRNFSRFKSMDESIAYIAGMPMEGEPGKTFHYGNAGLQIAAAVIEKISGKNFETLFQERIARPCDMKKTSFGSGVPLAAGGAKGTAIDYMHFLQMILNRGVYNGKQVLGEESIAVMQRNHIADARMVYSPAAGLNWGYGFGEWVMKEGAVSSPGLFGSFPWVDNEKGYCGMLFSVNLKNRQRKQLYTSLLKVVEGCLE